MPKKRAGRPTTPLVLTDEERGELERISKRGRVNRSLAFRARIVLGCAEETSSNVAAKRRTSNQTVGKWRKRFVEERLDGLYDEPRVGAPRTITDDDVDAVIVKTLETRPKGRTRWSTRSMAAAVGLSHATIGRLWRTFGLKPHVSRSFKISDDPQFIAKVRDVVGLYMNPPEHAVVLSFDVLPGRLIGGESDRLLDGHQRRRTPPCEPPVGTTGRARGCARPVMGYARVGISASTT